MILMAKLETAQGSTLGEEYISIDKEELRAIVKECVQKKFASLTENAKVVREGKVTPAGSVLGGRAPQEEAMGGGVPGAMAPLAENKGKS